MVTKLADILALEDKELQGDDEQLERRLSRYKWTTILLIPIVIFLIVV